MRNSLQKLIIEEMSSDSTPRTTSELARIVAKKMDIVPTVGSVSVVMQTLRNHPAYNLITTGKYPRQKYSLSSETNTSSDLHALAHREFETRLWAVRNTRGQA